MARKLSDQEALDRLARASDALGVDPGETVRAHTALTTARAAVSLLMLGLEKAAEDGADEVPGVTRPAGS
jgi:DNA polymerase III epsilon subunit-like protein